MTWDSANLYVGIVNANLAEGAVIYVTANPQNPPTCCSDSDGSLAGFNYDGTDFSSLPFRARFVTYVKDGYPRISQLRRRWRLDRIHRQLRLLCQQWRESEHARSRHPLDRHHLQRNSCILRLLRISDVQRWLCATDKSRRTTTSVELVGTSATATPVLRDREHWRRLEGMPPFSNEQPAGFSGADKAGFLPQTFRPRLLS